MPNTVVEPDTEPAAADAESAADTAADAEPAADADAAADAETAADAATDAEPAADAAADADAEPAADTPAFSAPRRYLTRGSWRRLHLLPAGGICRSSTPATTWATSLPVIK